MLSYADAEKLMASARDPRKGKPLCNNTRLYQRGNDYAVQLHYTDVVTIHPDGTYTISTGGWDTNVTWNRIWAYGGYRPTYKRFSYGSGWDAGYQKAVMPPPRAEDPEPAPLWNDIERPFTARNPGPEPVKSADGCIAGRVEIFEAVDTISHAEWEGEVPRGARNVRQRNLWEGDTTLQYEADIVASISVGADRWRSYHSSRPTDHDEYRQCPHCAAHDKVHGAWHNAYYGTYGRDRIRGYRPYREMMDRFGTHTAWADAYTKLAREVRVRNRERIQWARRNAMPVPRSFRVDADGHLLDEFTPMEPLPPTQAEAFDEILSAFNSDTTVPLAAPVEHEVKGTPIVAREHGSRRVLRFTGGEAFAVRCRKSKLVRMVSHLYVEGDRDYKWPPVVAAIKARLQSAGFKVVTVSRATLSKWSEIPATTHLPVFVMQRASRRQYGSAWHRMTLRPHHAGTMRLDHVSK